MSRVEDLPASRSTSAEGRPGRRSAGLTRCEAVVVPFAGERGGDGPLTLGQRNVAQWLESEPEDRGASLTWTFDVPVGTRVGDIAQVFGVLLARHEGLRTTFVGSGREGMVQRVAARGELSIEVFGVEPAEAGASEPADLTDPASIVQALNDRLVADPRPDGETSALPLRVGVVTAADAVVACVARYSHLVVDYGAMAVLGQEFGRLLRRPAARRVGPPRHQPLDQAAAEASPDLVQRAESALAHWERELTRMPPFMYAGTGTEPSGEPGSVVLNSPAAALALRHLAARTRVSRPTIVLAAVSAVLARVGRHDVCRFPVLSGNRVEPQLTNYVGTLVQAAPLAVDTVDASFDTLVRRAFMATLNAGRFGRYDAFRRQETNERLERERGVKLCMQPQFNNLIPDLERPGSADVRPVEAVTAAARRSRVRPTYAGPETLLLGFVLNRFDGAVVLRALTGDTGLISPGDLESLLLAVERLLIAAVPDDLEPAAVWDAVGLQPVPAGPEWALVESCWVRLAGVRRLLDEALAPDAAFVGASGGRLVAHLAAGAGCETPQRAHARCLEALATVHGAVTPQWYVIHDTGPGDPTDEAAWLGLPALSEGSGRAPGGLLTPRTP